MTGMVTLITTTTTTAHIRDWNGHTDNNNDDDGTYS